MSGFVDASILVSILGDEPDALEQAARVRDTADPFTSPVAIWETVIALVRSGRRTPEEARRDVSELMAAGGIRVAPIGAEEGQLAVQAFVDFGKGRHPANLNMGDCFAYACARANNARLLYKGDDFIHTDLA